MQCEYSVDIVEVSVSIIRSIERSILVEVQEERGHGYDTRGLLCFSRLSRFRRHNRHYWRRQSDILGSRVLSKTIEPGIAIVDKKAGIQDPLYQHFSFCGMRT